ncbi:hypothetical protein [Halalkalibacter urbisdiaboli]|uniref:hypothetical protein n=1 Tax=Halalkalibacter urbisdiaboli TaxID=1960589 RepID=UPI000B432A03|nr:hypothetical protein [Halalkalibacter urbisdiaboli]
MITCPNQVPWSSGLKAQYNESENKMGYLFPQKNGIKLAVDFPLHTLTKETVQSIINPTNQILYIPREKRAPTEMVDLTDQKLKEFFQEIIDYANQV